MLLACLAWLGFITRLKGRHSTIATDSVNSSLRGESPINIGRVRGVGSRGGGWGCTNMQAFAIGDGVAPTCRHLHVPHRYLPFSTLKMGTTLHRFPSLDHNSGPGPGVSAFINESQGEWLSPSSVTDSWPAMICPTSCV